MRPTCRSARSSKPSRRSTCTSQLDALAEHELDLYRTDLTRTQRHRRHACCARLNVADAAAARLPAHRPDRAQAARRPRRQAGAGARRRARQARRAGGALRRAERRQAADPFHAAAHPAHRRQAASPTPRRRRSRRRCGWRSGTIRTSLFAATDDAAHPRRRRDPAGRDVRRPTSTSTASCARATPSRSSTKRSPPTASRSPGARSAGRVLAAEFVNKGQTLLGLWFKDARRQGRLLRPRRPEQAALVPRQPARVLARDLGLLDAHAPDPATPGSSTTASTTARRTGTPVRSGRRRRGRVRRLAERLRQRRPDQARQRALDRLRAPEPHRRRARASASSRADASARSARPAGRPGRTCTSSSRSTASSRIRC